MSGHVGLLCLADVDFFEYLCIAIYLFSNRSPFTSKPMRVLLAIFILSAFAACKKSDDASTCALPTTFSKLKTMVKATEYSSSYTRKDTVNFFYNTAGQLDSIENIGSERRKISYLPDGRVDYVLRYSGSQTFLSTYTYQNNKVTIKVDDNYFVTYDLDQRGAITLPYYPNSNDRQVHTLDDCSQIIKEQSFYLADNTEHFLAQAAYSNCYDPLFTAGMYRISPGHSNLHLPKWHQIVHWDCADYDAAKIHHDIKKNAEGFPISDYSEALKTTVSYFYQ
jgi:hypothetical protein